MSNSSEAPIQQRFRECYDVLLPNHKRDKQEFNNLLIEKYGEEKVEEIDLVSDILNEVTGKILKDVLG